MPSRSTRRRFLQTSAAATAGAALGGETAALAQRADRPNVLLIVIDSLRTDYVGAYGGRARTPNIDALAREGLRFTRAYPEAMPTVPARNSILSGRRAFPFRGWYDRVGLIAQPGWSPLDDVKGALPAVLRRAGWWTACVTDNPFLAYARPYAPLRGSFHRFVRTGGQLGGGRPVSSVPRDVLLHWLHPAIRRAKYERVGLYMANSRYWDDERRSFAARVFGNAAELLGTAAHNRPFALMVDAYEPHEPWTPPPRYRRLYGDWRGPEPSMPHYSRASNWLSPRERGPVLRRMRDLYAAEVTMTDRWLGVLLDRLHDLGLEDDTVIVLVSDHGILLGEHGWTGKISTALHPALTRVPLIVVDPRRGRRARTSDWFASTHDVAPTVLSMAGVRAPRRMEGVDLSRPLRGRRLPRRPYAFGGYSNEFYIRTDRWAMWANNRPGAFHLFDLERDPGEHRNVARRHPGLVGELYETVRSRAGGALPYYD
ncbi:MAG: sulfatase family protein [Thermoleophilaceae bacterium]